MRYQLVHETFIHDLYISSVCNLAPLTAKNLNQSSQPEYFLIPKEIICQIMFYYPGTFEPFAKPFKLKLKVHFNHILGNV